MLKPATCQNTGVHHVGLYAKDPDASAEFYRDLLGMHIVGGSGADHPLGTSAFLCSRPNEESHEIALFANPIYKHVAFKVSSLAELRALHARVLARNLAVEFAFNHGVSFAFYFRRSGRQHDRGLLADRRAGALSPAACGAARSEPAG